MTANPGSHLRFRYYFSALTIAIGLVAAQPALSATLTITNNQPFSVEVARPGNSTIPAVHVEIAAGQKLVITGNTDRKAELGFASDGSIQYGSSSAGRLRAYLLIKEDRKQSGISGPAEFTAFASEVPLTWTQQDDFHPQVWKSETTTAGLSLSATFHLYPGGVLDLTTRVENRDAPETYVYCAVAWKWEQQEKTSNSICYDHRVSSFPVGSTTPYRSSAGKPAGDLRHLHVQRGVDWIRSILPDGSSATWMYDFAESFNVAKKAPSKSGASVRWVTANQSHLGNEAIASDDGLFMITELARPNIRNYRDRIVDAVLPVHGEAVEFAARMSFSETPVSDERADEMFVGYTCYKKTELTSSGLEIGIGVPQVRFGTNYFPYSTLGENFDTHKLPGMDRDGFWPLAADTVTQWQLFREDIRRDLRIARSLGYELIRLHHLELLDAIEPAKRTEYLDFLFSEIRHLGLKVLIDAEWTPETLASLVKRYQPYIDGVELDNEILIWGIDDNKPPKWNAAYDAVKAVAPEIPVHLTGHVNVGIFHKLVDLGVHFDKVGSHAYVDNIDAVPSARGFALAVGNFAGEMGREAIITEWNWRNLTRLSEESRAVYYRDIIGDAVRTRSIPTFYQFQFNETLCPSPRTGRGNILRHYEQLHLSRRPKLEALVMKEIIGEHGARRDVVTTPVVIQLRNGRGQGTLAITSMSSQTVPLSVRAETGSGEELKLDSVLLKLLPGTTVNVPFTVSVKPDQPGFYHLFVRINTGSDLPEYAWIEARNTGSPNLDMDSPTSGVVYPRGVREELGLDLSKPTLVLYNKDASVLEVETAILVAETLESATGRPVPCLQEDNTQSSADSAENILLVGTHWTGNWKPSPDDSTSLTTGSSYVSRKRTQAEEGTKREHLYIGGSNSRQVELAGIDFVLRYWRYAKDSAARKVGLVEKTLPKKGFDPAALP